MQISAPCRFSRLARTLLYTGVIMCFWLLLVTWQGRYVLAQLCSNIISIFSQFWVLNKSWPLPPTELHMWRWFQGSLKIEVKQFVTPFSETTIMCWYFWGLMHLHSKSGLDHIIIILLYIVAKWGLLWHLPTALISWPRGRWLEKEQDDPETFTSLAWTLKPGKRQILFRHYPCCTKLHFCAKNLTPSHRRILDNIQGVRKVREKEIRLQLLGISFLSLWCGDIPEERTSLFGLQSQPPDMWY